MGQGLNILKEYFCMVDESQFFRADFPDVDVIRVENTYYCVTTTMHFMPGGQILSSKDLIHWKHEAYVYATLDHTDQQRLEAGNVYGKGMWAASIRFHNGRFYVCFVANDTGKTYLYQASNIHGPWEKSYIKGFYHDCSLLFDDDGKKYIIYGNRTIYITQLKEDLSEPMECGLHHILFEDKENPILGYEGVSALKIKGTYYFFLIHSKSDRWRRVEACFYGDSLLGPFHGRDIYDEDLDFRDSGIAQGCIVDTPQGDWYAFLFQDRGAAGRMPVLLPVHFEGKQPVFESPLQVGKLLACQSEKRVEKESLIQSDSFEQATLKECWQFNHEPDWTKIELFKQTGLRLITGTLCEELTKAKNTLTQRMIFPECKASVLVDGTTMKDGDCAGIAAFLGEYGYVALKREEENWYVIMVTRKKKEQKMSLGQDEYEVKELERIPVENAVIRLGLKACFGEKNDTVTFYYTKEEREIMIGEEKSLYFRLDHFTGCRTGLFYFSTKEIGGGVIFKEFQIK